MITLFLKLFGDKFTKQAIKDRKLASYPGCREGLLSCLSTSCYCNGYRPSTQFVIARAEKLREEDAK